MAPSPKAKAERWAMRPGQPPGPFRSPECLLRHSLLWTPALSPCPGQSIYLPSPCHPSENIANYFIPGTKTFYPKSVLLQLSCWSTPRADKRNDFSSPRGPHSPKLLPAHLSALWRLLFSVKNAWEFYILFHNISEFLLIWRCLKLSTSRKIGAPERDTVFMYPPWRRTCSLKSRFPTGRAPDNSALSNLSALFPGLLRTLPSH